MLRGQNYENAFTFNILYLILLIHNTLSLEYNLIYVILSPEYRCLIREKFITYIFEHFFHLWISWMDLTFCQIADFRMDAVIARVGLGAD